AAAAGAAGEREVRWAVRDRDELPAVERGEGADDEEGRGVPAAAGGDSLAAEAGVGVAERAGGAGARAGRRAGGGGAAAGGDAGVAGLQPGAHLCQGQSRPLGTAL